MVHKWVTFWKKSLNMGHIFSKKNPLGPLHQKKKKRKKEKKRKEKKKKNKEKGYKYFSRTISKIGHLFLPKWPLTMVKGFLAQAARPVKLKCECATPKQIQIFPQVLSSLKDPKIQSSILLLLFASPNAYPTVVHKWVTFWKKKIPKYGSHFQQKKINWAHCTKKKKINK